MYNYKAKIINVVDGDTVDAQIDLGFKMTTVQRLRLFEIDCYEMNSKDPLEKAKAVEAKLFIVDLVLNKDVWVKTYKSDSFGRYLADIVIDDRDVCNLLIAHGLAVESKK